LADGHPKFGGTNDVDALDIGQNGGTRAGAGQALWVGRVDEEPADETDTRARLRTIYEELDAYRHGGLTTPDPKQLGATQLTSSDGATLSENAVMSSWKPTPRVHAITGGSFAALVEIEIAFVYLK